MTNIEFLVMDVDGVLTDGMLYYGANGELFKAFCAQDGAGIVMLQKAGVKTAIITARKTEIVTARAQELKIPYVFQGQHDKKTCLTNLLQQLQIKAQNVAYVGDDVVDIPPMQMVGFGCTVANAHPKVKAICDFQSQFAGGKGAIREICDMLIAAKMSTMAENDDVTV